MSKHFKFKLAFVVCFDEGNQKMFTFEKLELEHWDYFEKHFMRNNLAAKKYVSFNF